MTERSVDAGAGGEGERKDPTMKNMSRISRVLILATIILAPGVAIAQLFDGKELYAELQTRNKITSGQASIVATDVVLANYAAGYIKGVVDSLNGEEFCVPSGILVGQIIDLLFRYLDSHPEQRPLSAHLPVITALKEKFPCTKK
jgi:hypothetical protein